MQLLKNTNKAPLKFKIYFLILWAEPRLNNI
jgi:hypothetical protein